MLKYIKYAVAAVILPLSSIASAGHAIEGTGDTRSEAMRDAETRAKQVAQDEGTCITPPKTSDCRKDDGGWICVVYVANHQGSCG